MFSLRATSSPSSSRIFAGPKFCGEAQSSPCGTTATPKPEMNKPYTNGSRVSNSSTQISWHNDREFLRCVALMELPRLTAHTACITDLCTNLLQLDRQLSLFKETEGSFEEDLSGFMRIRLLFYIGVFLLRVYKKKRNDRFRDASFAYFRLCALERVQPIKNARFLNEHFWDYTYTESLNLQLQAASISQSSAQLLSSAQNFDKSSNTPGDKSLPLWKAVLPSALAECNLENTEKPFSYVLDGSFVDKVMHKQSVQQEYVEGLFKELLSRNPEDLNIIMWFLLQSTGSCSSDLQDGAFPEGRLKLLCLIVSELFKHLPLCTKPAPCLPIEIGEFSDKQCKQFDRACQFDVLVFLAVVCVTYLARYAASSDARFPGAPFAGVQRTSGGSVRTTTAVSWPILPLCLVNARLLPSGCQRRCWSLLRDVEGSEDSKKSLSVFLQQLRFAVSPNMPGAVRPSARLILRIAHVFSRLVDIPNNSLLQQEQTAEARHEMASWAAGLYEIGLSSLQKTGSQFASPLSVYRVSSGRAAEEENLLFPSDLVSDWWQGTAAESDPNADQAWFCSSWIWLATWLLHQMEPPTEQIGKRIYHHIHLLKTQRTCPNFKSAHCCLLAGQLTNALLVSVRASAPPPLNNITMTSLVTTTELLLNSALNAPKKPSVAGDDMVLSRQLCAELERLRDGRTSATQGDPVNKPRPTSPPSLSSPITVRDYSQTYEEPNPTDGASSPPPPPLQPMFSSHIYQPGGGKPSAARGQDASTLAPRIVASSGNATEMASRQDNQNNLVTQMVDRWLPAFTDFSHQLAETSAELSKSRMHNEQLSRQLHETQTQLDSVRADIERLKGEEKAREHLEKQTAQSTSLADWKAVQDSLNEVTVSLRELRQWLPALVSRSVQSAVEASLLASSLPPTRLPPPPPPSQPNLPSDAVPTPLQSGWFPSSAPTASCPPGEHLFPQLISAAAAAAAASADSQQRAQLALAMAALQQSSQPPPPQIPPPPALPIPGLSPQLPFTGAPAAAAAAAAAGDKAAVERFSLSQPPQQPAITTAAPVLRGPAPPPFVGQQLPFGSGAPFGTGSGSPLRGASTELPGVRPFVPPVVKPPIFSVPPQSEAGVVLKPAQFTFPPKSTAATGQLSSLLTESPQKKALTPKSQVEEGLSGVSATSTAAAVTTTSKASLFPTFTPSFGAAGPKTTQPSSSLFGGLSFSKFGETAAKTSPAKPSPTGTEHQKPPSTLSASADQSGDAPEAFEPAVDFQPCVEKLPELVAQRTGEEQEERIFCQRAVLHRWDREAGEWKARGTGEIHILADKEKKQYRVVMRRDQIKKLCANHFLATTLNFRKHPQDPRYRMWSARDFAHMDIDAPSNEGTDELFMICFKTAEIAQDFENVVRSCLAQLESQSASQDAGKSLLPQPPSSAASGGGKTTETIASKSAPAPAPGLEKLRAKQGSWECSVCTLSVDAKLTICPACQAAKPGSHTTTASTVTVAAAASTTPSGPVFSFKSAVSPSGGGAKPTTFQAPQTTGTPPPAFRFGAFSTQSSSVSGGSQVTFSFGAPSPSSSSSGQTSSIPFSLFGSKSQTNTPKSAPAPTSTSTPTAAPAGGSGGAFAGLSLGDAFQSAAKGGFTFSLKPTSSPSRPSPADGQVNTSEGGTTAVDESNEETPTDLDSSQFKPLLDHLPEKIVVQTGEEDEEIVFSARAKLYRFVPASEGSPEGWKERGIGTLKLLRSSPPNSRVRVVMRRDQILKVCCNHPITAQMKLRPLQQQQRTTAGTTPTLAWIWWAVDFAETDEGAAAGDSGRKETFSVRFKTPEDSEAFHQAFMAAVKAAGGEDTKLEPPRSSSTPNVPAKSTVAKDSKQSEESSDESDLVIVEQSPLSPEQVDRARALQLPDDFYAFETAPDDSSHRRHHHREAMSPEEEAAEDALLEAAVKAGSSAGKSGSLVISLSDSPDKSSSLSTTSVDAEAETETAPTAPSQPPTLGLASLKPKTGSWECDTCTLQVPPDATTCPACRTPKPVEQQQAAATTASSTTADTRGDSQKKLSEFVPAKSGFTDFSSLCASADAKPSWLSAPKPAESGAPRFWSDAGGGTLFSAQKTVGAAADQQKETETEEPEPDPQFEPIIPLPELVERRTGEEDEVCLFLRRCRLYRMVDKVWKERGIGEMKVLVKPKAPAPAQHTNTRTELPADVDLGEIDYARLLMRRDQVLKICANHTITAEVPKFNPLSSAANGLCWVTEDYSEGTGEIMTLGIKFKTEQDVNAFKAAIERARTMLKKKH
ncbi:Protein CBR-NPP-9 [Sparganum proliferum]